MKRPRVLFINDLGFQYGAGVAQARQIEAMLHLGWEVAALAWEPGDIKAGRIFTRPAPTERWLGMRKLRHLELREGLDSAAIVEGILIEAARLQPDLVVAGNLHSARWPLELLGALPRLGCRVAAYLHDCYLLTGRCPYPSDCQLYLHGCNETCPTAREYPPLEPELIHDQWQLRRTIFGGNHHIEVLANSNWTAQMFRKTIPSAPNVSTLYLGADENVFQPGDRVEAKRALGLPTNKPLVLCAAINFHDKRKGATYLRAVIEKIGERAIFAGFGHNTETIPRLIPMGYHVAAHDTARIIRAADIFIGAALEEAFGQTIVEAQLSGCPVVAFNVGGVPEIVSHGQTGYLVPPCDTTALATALDSLIKDPALREQLGSQARLRSSGLFSISAHARSWARFLDAELKSPS